MSIAPSVLEDPAGPPAADEAPDASVLRAERRLRLLDELAEIGMELARALRPGALASAACDPVADEDVIAETGPAKRRDPADAFAPLSRAIRLTLALEARTDADLRDLKAGVVRARQEARTAAAERRQAAEAKDAEAREEKIRDLALEAAEAEIEDVEAMVELCDALEERLDADPAYGDRAQLPLREIVEQLCADLTLSPDWRRWDGEGWARIEPYGRPHFSRFNQPSARPLFVGAGGASGGSADGRLDST